MNFSLQDINEIVRNNEIKDYIKSFEEDFERTLDKIAKDAIEGKHGDKIVLLAGPSSSGKTTFAKKLVLALKKNGVDSKLISLDNFYLPVDKMPRNEKGKPDMESVFALDLTDAAAFFSDLFETHKATMPIFDFKEQTAPRERETIDFSPGTILVVEGIHALNDEITKLVPRENAFEIYVSVKKGFSDAEEIVFTKRDVRLFRRLVRDFYYRNSLPENTFCLWPDVLAGDIKNIKPFQDKADVHIDTAFPYDPGVLRNALIPILEKVDAGAECFPEVKDILGAFERVLPIPEELVPPTSLLREFIGGGLY